MKKDNYPLRTEDQQQEDLQIVMQELEQLQESGFIPTYDLLSKKGYTDYIINDIIESFYTWNNEERQKEDERINSILENAPFY